MKKMKNTSAKCPGCGKIIKPNTIDKDLGALYTNVFIGKLPDSKMYCSRECRKKEK